MDLVAIVISDQYPCPDVLEPLLAVSVSGSSSLVAIRLKIPQPVSIKNTFRHPNFAPKMPPRDGANMIATGLMDPRMANIFIRYMYICPICTGERVRNNRGGTMKLISNILRRVMCDVPSKHNSLDIPLEDQPTHPLQWLSLRQLNLLLCPAPFLPKEIPIYF
jgi:hypothetical protein